MVLTEYGLCSDRNLTIALVADLHERNSEDTIRLLKQSQPDLICIAGDTFERYGIGEDPRMKENPTAFQRMVYRLAHKMNGIVYRVMGNRREADREEIYRFIQEVTRIPDGKGQAAAVYMSLGNHEWKLSNRDMEALRTAGVRLLDNEDVQDLKQGIRIGGLSTRADQQWLSEFSRKSGFKLLLCHHPEYYEKYLKDKNIDLILSGHAHGGQIRVFGRGLLSPGQGLLPRYHHGIYEGRLVVSAGCTNTASIPRWGNPCEVVVIKLRISG